MSTKIPLKILTASSEIVPFAKSGGLADMTASLSSHFAVLGHDVRVVLPAYRDTIFESLTTFSLSVKVGFREETVLCHESRLPGSNVRVYLLDHPLFSEREGIYGNSEQSFFPDNGKRFALLSRGVFSLIRTLGWYPDIIHSHDWPTALVPAYLNSLESDIKKNGTISVFTIHNIGYQGVFSLHDLHYTRLRPRDICPSADEHMDQLNFLRTGITCADVITTVSPRYAREIRTPEYGHGLEQELDARREDLFGIVNGIDTMVWNPATDPYLPADYSSEKPDNKRLVKAQLQRSLGLTEDPSVPLIGMISRLVEQKGFRELCGPEQDSMARILSTLKCQIVLLGTGEPWCEQSLEELSGRFSNLKALITFDEAMAHRIEGGSDFFLMPSRYEPCGLNQMYSLRYGTIPIVRRTGGLADTVISSDTDPEKANGFLFDEMSGDAIYQAVAEALEVFYSDPERINTMRVHAMKEDFSWDHSAQHYIELFRYSLRKVKASVG